MKSKLNNRILSVVLCLSLILGVVIVKENRVFAASDASTGLSYSVSGGAATITGYIPPAGFDGTLAIPDMLGGASVTGIGNWVFSNRTSLTSITIPSSVTSIGEGAFSYCTSLTDITIPSSVMSIGEQVFFYCSSLTSITVDAANTTYKSIDGILYSKDGTVLICCPGGKSGSITIPSSATSIGDYAFWGCHSVTSITISSSVTSIGYAAIESCSSLTSITIPSSVTSIGDWAFDSCTSLSSITIPSSVTSIGECVFSGCTSLTGITIPSSVTSIGGGAFYECTSLTGITIPSSVTSIGSYAFEGCTSLTSITIPDSVTAIEEGMFALCAALTSVTIPASVTSIGARAFYGCTGLTSVTIPDSVISVDSYAFQFCTGLMSVTIGSGVTDIAEGAFGSCEKLTSAYFYGNAPKMGAEVFGACAPAFTVHYLSGRTGYTNPWEGYPTAVWNGVYQDEAKTREFVTRFYQLCLGREPDAGGLTYWADSLLSGSLSGADLSNQLVFSEEFRNRNVTNDEYITIMYKSFFGRDPDAGGKDYWMSVFDSGMSRYYVLAGFVNSEEFKNICNTYGISVGSLTITAPVDQYPQITSFVTRFYKLCLNRMPDAAGLDHWVVQLQTQNLAGANVAHDIVTSEEFTNRGTTNDEFVEIMYKAFFDRASEASGKAYWTGRLAAGTSRYTVLAGFVNSQEFTNICTTYGINRGSM